MKGVRLEEWSAGSIHMMKGVRLEEQSARSSYKIERNIVEELHNDVR